MVDINLNSNLNIDRKLIDPKFEGYKLSLDPIPIYKTSLKGVPRVLQLKDDQYSYQHVKIASRHNHLILDPWNPRTVYYVTSDKTIIRVNINEDNHLIETSVFKIPSIFENAPDTCNISFYFVAANWLVLSDGINKLYIIYTGCRTEGLNWEVKFVTEPCENKPFVLVYANYRETPDQQQFLNCLIIHIDEKSNTIAEDYLHSNFLSTLEWINLSLDGNGMWNITRIRKFQGSDIPDYAAVDFLGEALVIAADKPFKMIYDSIKSIEETKKEKNDSENETSYTWGQTSEDVVVSYPVKQPFTKLDVTWNLTSSHIDLGLKDGTSLLKGQLSNCVNTEGSVWIMYDNIIEVFL